MLHNTNCLTKGEISCNTKQVWRCAPANALWVKSAMIALTGGTASFSEVLSEDVRLSIYFRFKALITLFTLNCLHCLDHITCTLIAQKRFFCDPSNPNKFQIFCQRKDLIRQKSFSLLIKCFKSKQKFLIFRCTLHHE